MIIVDEEDELSKKAAQDQVSPVARVGATPGSSALRGDLHGTNGDHALLDAEAGPDAPPSYDESTFLLQGRSTQRTQKRFVQAFAAALGVWLLASLLFGRWIGRLQVRPLAVTHFPSSHLHPA
jgi:hypothetical protein